MHRNIYFFEKKREEIGLSCENFTAMNQRNRELHIAPWSPIERDAKAMADPASICPRGARSSSASHARRRRSTIPDLTPIATAATAAISLPPDLPPRRRAADTAEKMGEKQLGDRRKGAISFRRRRRPRPFRCLCRLQPSTSNTT